MDFPRKNDNKRQLGPTEQKILLLLAAGASLALTRRPDYYFRIIQSTKREWQKINQRSLRDAIRRLYQSHMIDYKENNDGTTIMVLTDSGKKRTLKYNLDKMEIKKPVKWDGLWRIVIFDIPENKKQGRDALASKLKRLGLKPLQKSVFVYPHNCQKEIEFVAEIFEVRPYVRFILAKDIDVALDLKQKFHLI